MYRLTQNIKKYQALAFVLIMVLAEITSVHFVSAAALQTLDPAPKFDTVTPVTVQNTSPGNSNNSSQNASGNSASSGSSSSGGGIVIPEDTGLPSASVAEILTNFFTWLLLIFGILAVGAFIISGIQYLVSAGDDKSVATAKMNMKWSVIGVAVGLSGYIILKAVEAALNASTTPF